ncbi:BTAD domain-containing putative transcriptional regulator [Streptomyces griseoviridis]
MRVSLLGPVTLRLEAGDRPVAGALLRGLLARLALSAGRAVRTETLVDALWGTQPPADPANALQTLVSRLRRAVDDPALIEHGSAGYRLVLDPGAVDAVRFEELARSGRRLLTREQHAEAAATLRDALALWRGPALADVRGAPFAGAEADRLEQGRLGALEDRIEAELALDVDPSDLVAELRSLTAEHPLRERSHAQLMRALTADGRPAEALAVYQELRDRLADAFGSDPGPEPQAAHLAILRGEARGPELPPPARRSEPPGNLHAPTNRLVGRDDDLRRLAELLDHARLVTLVGPGGVGKTRLATAIGRRLTPPGGVWLAALAPVDADGVPSAVLDVLRLREGRPAEGAGRAAKEADGPAERADGPAERADGPGEREDGPAERELRSAEREDGAAAREGQRGPGADAVPASPQAVGVMDQLAEAVADDDLVLVLDNCEHVVDAVARLAEALLGRCPRLRVLATSREPLRADGEFLHPVHPLDVPEPGAALQRVLGCSAARLLAERAAAASPGFTVDDDSLASVTEICRRLDGLPLAIELAAARLRILPLAAVAARLDDRFRLLSRGNRTALPRHRTLSAVVEWSWDLLTPAERTLLERLSAVPATFTEDAARAVAAPERSAHDVEDLLTSLAEKSLLQPAARPDATEPRYGLQETIRAYGLDRLADRQEIDEVRDRHTAYFLRLAETTDPLLRTRDQVAALGRLSAERDNVLAAVRRAIDIEDTDTAQRFGAALGWYWNLRGGPPESADLLTLIVALPGESAVHARTVAAHALAVQATDEPHQVETAFARLRALLPQLAADPHPVPALARLALAVSAPPDEGAPAEFLLTPGSSGTESAADLLDDPWSSSFRLLTGGLLALHTGDVDRARDDLTRALRGFERVGERWGLGITLSTLASILRLAGELDTVPGMIARANRCFAELGMGEHSIENEAQGALIRARTGDVDGARGELTELLDRVTDLDAAEPRAQVRLALAQLEWWAGNAERAREHGEAGLAEGPPGRFPPAHLVALLLVVLAQVDAGRGLPDDGLRRLDHPAVHQLLGWDTPVASRIAVAVAAVELARGRGQSAGQLLGIGARLRGAEDPTDPEVAQVTRAATELLGETGFAAAYRVGLTAPRGRARERVAEIVTTRGCLPTEPVPPPRVSIAEDPGRSV